MKKLFLILSLGLLTACRYSDREWQPHAERVTHAYTHLKQTGVLPDSVNLEAEAAWLYTHKHARYAGESYYILGAYENLIGNDSAAMHYLKLAEQCWNESTDAPAALVGMTCYKQGRISENEHLPEVALYHYRRALPYLMESGDSLYISSVYREIARMTTDSVEQRQCFEQAVAYAESLSIPLQLDTRYAMLSHLSPESEERLAISTQLCDSAGLYRYAADVVRAALRNHDLPRAQHYLSQLARDTASLEWSRHQYALLQAQYLYRLGAATEAYDVLETLYRQRIGEMERDGAARSFTIAERFDNATEREHNLRLRLKHQRLRMGLVILILLLITAIATGAFFYARTRTTVHEKQEQLRQMLLRQIARNRRLNNIFEQTEDWENFRTAFDSAYNEMLSRLEQDYPALTTADLQVIALTTLGLDISDICLLLNQSKRTIYNRRQRINDHLHQTNPTQQLDDMIRHYLPFILLLLTTAMLSCSKDVHNPEFYYEFIHATASIDTITPPNNPLAPGKHDPKTDTLYYAGVIDIAPIPYNSYRVALYGVRLRLYDNGGREWYKTGSVYLLTDAQTKQYIRFNHPLLTGIHIQTEVVYAHGLLQTNEVFPQLYTDTILRPQERCNEFLPD